VKNAVAAASLLAAAAATAVVVTAAPALAQGVAAPGGIDILAAAERAVAVVTGVVSQPKKIDLHGWEASVRVDGVLTGKAALGETLTVGWEELASSRPVRFSDGGRVLVVLDPLPTQSLWQKRFPPRDKSRRVLVVAARGDAFLRDPDGATAASLEHFWAMNSDARDSAPGALRIAELVAAAPPPLAAEALERLESRQGLAASLGADGGAILFRAARDAARPPSLRERALMLAARERLPGTREVALELTQPGSAVRAAGYRALATLPDGLPVQEVGPLLDDPDPQVRAAAAALASDDSLRPRLQKMAHGDPAPEVRAAAAIALLDRYGEAEIDDTIPLLDDGDKLVRSAVAARIGALGSAALPALKRVLADGSTQAMLAAVLGLTRAGDEGAKELFFVANSHEDETVRAFANLALGKGPGHKD